MMNERHGAKRNIEWLEVFLVKIKLTTEGECLSNRLSTKNPWNTYVEKYQRLRINRGTDDRLEIVSLDNILNEI